MVGRMGGQVMYMPISHVRKTLFCYNIRFTFRRYLTNVNKKLTSQFFFFFFLRLPCVQKDLGQAVPSISPAFPQPSTAMSQIQFLKHQGNQAKPCMLYESWMIQKKQNIRLSCSLLEVCFVISHSNDAV